MGHTANTLNNDAIAERVGKMLEALVEIEMHQGATNNQIGPDDAESVLILTAERYVEIDLAPIKHGEDGANEVHCNVVEFLPQAA